MFTRPTTKTVFGKVSRSGFYYFITVILPVKRPTEKDNKFDVLGGLMVVGLSTVMVILMRFMLAN
jgi:hypothetical protein